MRENNKPPIKVVKKRRTHARKILHVGIASVEDMKARTLAIAQGRLKPSPSDPSVWFPSTETLGKVLSGSNRKLLAEIHSSRPVSLKELSEMTGRKVSNLSRTLRTMQRYGLVKLDKGPHGSVRPEVPYAEVDVKVPLFLEPA